MPSTYFCEWAAQWGKTPEKKLFLKWALPKQPWTPLEQIQHASGTQYIVQSLSLIFHVSLVGTLLDGLRRKRNVYLLAHLFPRLMLAEQEEWRRSAGLTKDIFANDTYYTSLSLSLLLLMMNIEKVIWIELELAKSHCTGMERDSSTFWFDWAGTTAFDSIFPYPFLTSGCFPTLDMLKELMMNNMCVYFLIAFCFIISSSIGRSTSHWVLYTFSSKRWKPTLAWTIMVRMITITFKRIVNKRWWSQ